MAGAAVKIMATGLLALGAWPANGEWFSERFDDAVISVRLVRDASQLTSLLGTGLEGDYVLAEVKVRPLYNSRVVIMRDDFIMRSRRNNERSTAMSPEEIAGGSVLVLGSRRVSTGSPGVYSQENDPVIIGGAPGTGSRPRKLGGLGQNVGTGSGDVQKSTVSAEQRPTNALLERLRQHELPVGETRKSVRGYLYFQVPSRHKLKHYQFTYDGNVGEFSVGFLRKKTKR